jgi:hypothetical protein
MSDWDVTLRPARHPALYEHQAYSSAHHLGEDTGLLTTAPIPADDLVVRVSSGSQADLCMGRLYHRGELGHEDTRSEAVVFGTVQHRLVEVQVGQPDMVVGPGAVMPIVAAVGEEEGLDIPALLGDTIASWVADQVNLAAAWRRWARANLGYPLTDPISERALAAPLCRSDEGRTVWLAGTPDLILPHTGTGYDWKTANKGWPPQRAASQNQQYAYAWLAHEVLGLDLAYWQYVVANRAKTDWDMFEVPVSQHGIDGYLARMRAMVRSLERDTVVYHPKSGTSGKRGWWCSPMYCGSWSVCPARFLGDSLDLARADTSGGWPVPREG